MKTKKAFDCVEMKQRGAERVQKELSGMTPEEELAYWRNGTQALQKKQQELRPVRSKKAIYQTTALD